MVTGGGVGCGCRFLVFCCVIVELFDFYLLNDAVLGKYFVFQAS